jgi:hypothetical protein
MSIAIIRICALFAILATAALGEPRPALAQTDCNSIAAAATIDDAYKLVPEPPLVPGGKPTPPPASRAVELGDIIAVKVANLAKLYDSACRNRTIVLFLNGQPINALSPFPPTSPSDNVLDFVLHPTDASKSSWAAILGWPTFSPRPITVSIGFADQFPLKATNGTLPILDLTIIPAGWFLLWLVIFAGMVAVFFVSAHKSNIIRDGNPINPDVSSIKGTYSLAKTQGAWWFFVILAAYLFIGIITGDFSNSINSTALILLGIGAGTVLGSAAIDAQNTAPDELEAEQKKAVSLKADLQQLHTDISNLNTARNAVPRPTDDILRQNASQLAQKQEEKAQKLSAYKKLMRYSEGFLTDILSDANGISFHRFQIFAWTIVLSVIFIKEVYTNLAMPVFNTTLMGLLGLSAGTYLGLKIPEATTPT